MIRANVTLVCLTVLVGGCRRDDDAPAVTVAPDTSVPTRAQSRVEPEPRQHPPKAPPTPESDAPSDRTNPDGDCQTEPSPYPSRLEFERRIPQWSLRAPVLGRPGEDVWTARRDDECPYPTCLSLGSPHVQRKCAAPPGSPRAILTTAISVLHELEFQPGRLHGLMLGNVDAIESCYEPLLDEHPYIKARPDLEVEITKLGRVDSTTFVRPSIDDEVRQCLQTKISAWRFPKSKAGGKVRVTFLVTAGTPKEAKALRTSARPRAPASP